MRIAIEPLVGERLDWFVQTAQDMAALTDTVHLVVPVPSNNRENAECQLPYIVRTDEATPYCRKNAIYAAQPRVPDEALPGDANRLIPDETLSDDFGTQT